MSTTATELNSVINSELDSDADQFLTFVLGAEEYGVDILRVQEIKGWDSVTPIPNTPEYIKGVINLRGTIVPIVDLRQRFSMPEVEYGPITVVIVLKIECADRDRIMGIVVDGVSDVYDVPPDEMKEAPDFGNVVDTEFVQGLATVDEKMIIILDIDHLLSGNEIAATDSLAV